MKPPPENTYTMQPDPSITFISPKNKRIWAGKRRDFARHDEVLEHLARQAGMPPLPQTRGIRFYRRYTSCAGIGALITGIFVLGLAIGWFLAIEFWRYLGDQVLEMGCAIVTALMLLSIVPYTQTTLDQLVYPPCVTQLYRQLRKSGQLTSGEVRSIEVQADTKYLIHYQFTLFNNKQNVIGQYVTDRQIPGGTKLAVIYLDATCHAPL